MTPEVEMISVEDKKGSRAEKTLAAGFTSTPESKPMKDRSVMTRFVTQIMSHEQQRHKLG